MKLTNKTIRDVADVIAGQSPPSNLYNKTGTGLPFYQGKTDFGEKFPAAKTWCTGAKNKEAIQNDILLSVRAPVGPVNICQVRSVIGRGLSAIRAKRGISFEYLYYYLKTHEQDIAKYGTGSTFKAITQTHINRIQLPIPESYNDQIRIATVLTRAERLIAKRKESIKALDELLRSTFLEMFGNPGNNEKGWEKIRWDNLFNTRTGKLNANAMSDDGEYPFFTCAKEIYKIDFYDFDCEALILAGNNATADYDVKYYKGKFNAYQRTYILELINSKHSYRFYQYHLEYKLGQLKDGSKGANTRYLTKQFLDPILFLNPPVELQLKFAAIVEKVESIKAKKAQSLAELENLYASLSQRAFKGELDLSGVEMERSLT